MAAEQCFERRCPQRLPIDGLIELILGLRLCHGVPVRQRLDPLVPSWRPARGRDRRRSRGLANVDQYPLDRGGLGKEGDDAPIGTAVRADQLGKDSNRRVSSMAHR